MPCLICGKTEIRRRIGISGFSITPDCKCGSVRGKQRKSGCPNCNSGIIDLEYMSYDDTYIAICRDCKREWIV